MLLSTERMKNDESGSRSTVAVAFVIIRSKSLTTTPGANGTLVTVAAAATAAAAAADDDDDDDDDSIIDTAEAEVLA